LVSDLHLHPEGYTVLAIVDRYAVGVEVINDWNGFGQRTTASGTVKLTMLSLICYFLMNALLPTPQMFAVLIHNFYRLRLMLALPVLII
jgi:alkylation response protein AidB-like acyl-CoA dehydrogenase